VSTPLTYSRGRVWCPDGEVHIAQGLDGGIIEPIGPLVLVSPDDAHGWENMARGMAGCGVDLSCDGHILKISAANGSWVWRLEPAHWVDPILGRPPGWGLNVMLGRWPD